MLIVGRSLPSLLRAAAAEQGKQIDVATDPTGMGRLGYRLSAGDWMTPGETAEALGVVWPAVAVRA